MKTTKAQLVVVVGPLMLGDRLASELRALGVSGYTTMHVNGFGRTGARTYDLTDAANFRLETVVSPDLCEQIMKHVDTHYRDESLVAHHHEVTAIPAAHFGVVR